MLDPDRQYIRNHELHQCALLRHGHQMIQVILSIAARHRGSDPQPNTLGPLFRPSTRQRTDPRPAVARAADAGYARLVMKQVPTTDRRPE